MLFVYLLCDILAYWNQRSANMYFKSESDLTNHTW